MNDRLLLFLLKITPTAAISRLAGRFAHTRFSRCLIPRFARLYNIDASEAETAIAAYPHLNAFFTRKLKPHLRPVDPNPAAIVSPCDGTIAAVGTVAQGCMLQAKSVPFSVADLLALPAAEAATFDGGAYMTIYLSPRDYHRFHAPVDGVVTGYSCIPGTLFPVNAFGVRAVRGLFARNERLATFLRSHSAGKVAIVKVGAMMVGSVNVVYCDATTNVRGGRITHATLPEPVPVAKGADLGHFAFGSTIILLFEKGKAAWLPDMTPGRKVRFGERIGTLTLI